MGSKQVKGPITEDTADRRALTHQRILDAAGRLFRAHGTDGVGVDSVMKEAGLTHGGFYAHFASKEALVAEVAQTLLQQAAQRWDHVSRTRDRTEALENIVTSYLDHDHVASNACCPLTTLGPDVARRETSRSAIHDALVGMVQALTRCLPGRRRAKALVTLSTMVGAVVIARLADDPALAEDVLDAAAASILGNHTKASLVTRG
jgi:TetR/AcrR family transcriptional repressor of nem operon